MIKLYPHQQQELEATAGKNKVAYYHDMGLGKTFTGAEKMLQLHAKVNLVVCQKSKVDDWMEHFCITRQWSTCTFDLTRPQGLKAFLWEALECPEEHKMFFMIGVIKL